MDWGNIDAANNAPTFKSIATGSSIANQGNTLYANVTVGSFLNNISVGIFGVDQAEATALNVGVHPGWVLTRVGTGPLTGITVSGGTGFSNGDTVTVSNGTVNAVAVLTTNATGNLVSGSVLTRGSGFANAAVAVSAFNREQHLVQIIVGGTPTGYSNTDYVIASNGSINAVANVSTNATGGSLTFTITNPGTFANTLPDAGVVLHVYANTGANSAGSGATLTANINPSSGGTIGSITLGGHSGRVFRETLVYVRGMANNSTSGGGSTSP